MSKWRAQLTVGILLLSAVLAGGYGLFAHRNVVEDRVYRIGFSDSPPLHFPSPSTREPTGLAVNVVKEAARRRGIRLQWEYTPDPAIPALLNRTFDLWVAMTVLPERRKKIFISEPFLITEYCLLVRSDSKFTSAKELTSALISHSNVEINLINLQRYFPHARRLPELTSVAAIEAMVDGKSDAVLVDQFSTARAFMEQKVKHPVRILSLPIPRNELGIASTLASAPVASALRDEIRKMIDEGSIAERIDGWSLFPVLNLEAINNLSNAKRREQGFIAGLVAVISLLICVVLLFISLRRDHRQLKQAKSDLRDSDEHYRSLVELLPDTIYLLDRQGRLQSAVTAPNLLRRTDALIHRLVSESEPHRKDVETVLRTGAQTITDMMLDGIYPLEYRLVPLRDAAGMIRGVLGILRDQTARQLAEEERYRLEQQLRQSQKMEVVGRLAGGIAHDFNNLLTVINGYSAGLLNQLPQSSPEAQQLAKILRAGNTAAELTRQLLTFSRTQQVDLKLRDLNTVIENAADMLRRLLGDDIDLQIRLEPALPPILADSGQLEQVLMNLAANARDAMPQGGSFILSTSLQILTSEQAAKQIGAARGPHVLLTAKDSGTGIDSSNISYIFDPFFTTKQDSSGTGLGLSIVYGIIRQSGGWITIDTELGTGTTFELHFPAGIALPAAEIAVPQQLPSKPQQQAGTILVVEDRSDVLILVADLLRGAGYRVLEAPSPAVGISYAERSANSIDLVLTDVAMPGMRGPELARRLRALRPGLKIIFMTGFPDQMDLVREKVSLDSAVIQKPFGPEELLSTVEALLAGVQVVAATACATE